MVLYIKRTLFCRGSDEIVRPGSYSMSLSHLVPLTVVAERDASVQVEPGTTISRTPVTFMTLSIPNDNRMVVYKEF